MALFKQQTPPLGGASSTKDIDSSTAIHCAEKEAVMSRANMAVTGIELKSGQLGSTYGSELPAPTLSTNLITLSLNF
jgi:hypothetical protein